MDPQYGKRYRELYERHWWWRAREAAVLGILERALAGRRNQRILDVGCGDGLFFGHLGKFGQVEGIEPDGRLVDPNGPHVHQIRICEFDSNFRPAQKYDLILMLDVLEHIANAQEALTHACDLLNAGGILLLTVPALQILWTSHDAINHHYLRYRKGTLFPLLEKAGFRITRSRYWFQWIVPLKFIARIFEKLWHMGPEIPRIPSEPVNWLLYSVSRVEQETIGRVGFPIGTSLAVLAVKP